MRSGFARRAPLFILMYPLLLIGAIAAVAFTPSEVKDKAEGLTLFFIGSRRSEIEPCGCKVRQLGGVQYEATIYDREGRDTSLRFDVGGWSIGTLSAETAMRTRYALRAMGGYLDLDAVNVGRSDLEMGHIFFETLEKEEPKAWERVISANIYPKETPDQLAFSPYRIVERNLPDGTTIKAAITGVSEETSPHRRRGPLATPGTVKDYVIRDPSAALASILPALDEKADLLVVLLYGSWELATRIAKLHPAIDVLICSMTPPGESEKVVTVGNTKIVHVRDWQGKLIGKIDLLPEAQGRWSVEGNQEWVDVSPKLPAVRAMEDLIQDFKANTEELMIERPRGVKRIYVGARSCASCHRRAYESWTKTPHAHALETLIGKSSQYQSTCLECHTLGFKHENGFYNVRQSRPMGGIQCESCHGPSAEHADRQRFIRTGTIASLKSEEQEAYIARAKEIIPPRSVEASTCLKCHEFEDPSDFDFEHMIRLINHTDGAG